MKYFVTGCAGFIASQVALKLLADGHQVVGVDDLNDYYDVRVKRWRLDQLAPHESFTFHEADIRDYPAMEKLYREHQFAATFNLAARAGVRASVEDPWVYYETNVNGTLNLLECARRHDVKKFILASTSSIYGETATPFSVENVTDTPLSPYAASKKGAEALCYSYHYLYDLDISIPRYFTVYGPAGRPDMSYFKFMLKMDRGEPIPVFGDGKQSRDFTYVEDIAEATVRALKLKGYNIFNVGNDRPVELIKMINIVEELMGKKAVFNYLPRHPADNPITWADVSKTRQLLEWQPKVPLEEGLSKVMDWFRANREWLRTVKID